MAKDFFGNVGSAISNGFSTLGKTASREVSRIGKETIENINGDFKQIDNGIKRGGFVGGALETLDVLSVGHQAANVLDATNVIPENEALKEAISGGINLVAMPGPFQLLALKDAADAIGALNKGPQAPQAPRSAAHEPASPSTGACHQNAKEAALERAKEKSLDKRERIENAKEAAKERALERARERSGYATIGDGLNGKMHDIIDCWRDMLKPMPADPGDVKNGSVDDEERKMLNEIKRILNTPGMMFEDMIFALMQAVVRGTQKQVRALAKEIHDDGKRGLDGNRDGRRAVAAARKELGDAQASKDPAKIAAAETKLADVNGDVDDARQARSDSRSERFEQLKNMMNQLSEMQQALSNVLNNQHEAAMGAIRNIR
jgi:hypothetical protein